MFATQGLLLCLAKGMSYFHDSLLLPLCHLGVVKQVRVGRTAPVVQ